MPSTTLTGLLVAVLAVGVAIGLGLYRRATSGRRRPDRAAGGAPIDATILTALGAATGQPVLLQFSSEVCGPCRTTSRHCAEVAAGLDGVRHVEVDVAGHTAVIRALAVRRTPTVLVLDPAGRVVARVEGVPRPGELAAAIGAPDPVRSP